jgi:hypothetical protein
MKTQQDKPIGEQITDVFIDGPGFLNDVMMDTGFTKQRASSNLSDLVKRGKLVRIQFRLPEDLRRERNERMDSREWVWMYSLPSYEDIAA